MIRLLALAALAITIPLRAQADMVVESAVFLERLAPGASGPRRELAPAERFLRGDNIVTIMRWNAPAGRSYTLTSAVPDGLSLQSTSLEHLDYSTDGGRNWHRAVDPRRLPRGITHLRWRAGSGAGRFSYRALVL